MKKSILHIALLVSLVCLVIIAYHSERATKVKPASDAAFSAVNAYEYLTEIAKEPHPIGSKANKKVRDYLMENLEHMGLDVRLETGYTWTSWKPSYSKMAYVENIVATLNGSDPNGKTVMLAGHYDSVVEGPGAADDGYAVACMLETVRLLSSQKRKNNIQLLITDGEEYGLLGAQYHIENNDLSHVGVVLNYEARGAAGPGIAFEWSEDNAWLVDEMASCYERPIANSLSYEIYKRMPNGSDFTIFKEASLPGINHAFIDDFSYYHHPHDDLAHVSMNSIQHTGENMYLATRHFSNFDFAEVDKNTKSNSTFFNFYGRLIRYPESANLPLLILTLLLGMAAIYISHSTAAKQAASLSPTKDRLSLKGAIGSFFSILGVLLLAGGLAYGLGALAKDLYPQYATFYSYHYYNHEWYLLAAIGLTIALCAALGRLLLVRQGRSNVLLGLILTLSFLSIAIYYFAPTGAYIMMLPLLVIALGTISQCYWASRVAHTVYLTMGGLALAFVIGMWTQISHSLFLAFSLGALPGAILPTVLFSIAGLVLMPDLWKDRKVLPIAGFALFIGSMIVAHMHSKPSEEYPLLVHLFYAYDSESETSYVATSDMYLNEGHTNILTSPTAGRLDQHLPYSRHYQETEVDLSPYRSQISRDSLVDGSRSVTIVHPLRPMMIHLSTDDVSNVAEIKVNGEINKIFKEGANGIYYSPMYGIGLDSLTVTVRKRDNDVPTTLYINTKYMELPQRRVLPRQMLSRGAHTTISEAIHF